MTIIESPYITEQFRFPRTKKRRIRNKWSKRPENWRPSRRAYLTGDTLYVHPKMATLIRAQMDTPFEVVNAIGRNLFTLL